MTVSYFTVSETISGTLWEPQAAGDGVYVAPFVTLISTGAIAFLAQRADVTAQIDGAVIGTSALAFTQGGSIEIGGQGSLTGTSGNAIGVVGAYSISNAGRIDGAVSGIRVDGQGTIVNDGAIYGGSQAGVEEADSAADIDRLYNHGTISGPEFGVDDVNAHVAYIYNSGAIDGGAGSFGGGGLGAAVFASDQTTEHLYNSGTISGEVDLWAAGSSIANSGQINGDVHLQNGGARVVNKGAIAGDLSFTMTGNLFNGIGGSVAGTIFGDGADGVYYGGGDGETFDMTASGAALVVGDAGLDQFTFRVTGLTAETTVTGGGGADTLKFTTAGKITASALSHVAGIETIALANGSNALALTNALVGTAEGASLRVFGGTGEDAINAARVTNAADKLTIKGGGGADTIKAGGEDTFVYAGAADSTNSSYDAISGANFALDRFHLVARTIAAIDPKVTTGSLSTASFNADLAAAIGAGKLGAHDAVLFTASAGTLAGQTFLIADLNGIAGYQAGKDLVVHLTGQTGTLTTGSFA